MKFGSVIGNIIIGTPKYIIASDAKRGWIASVPDAIHKAAISIVTNNAVSKKEYMINSILSHTEYLTTNNLCSSIFFIIIPLCISYLSHVSLAPAPPDRGVNG
jgi:hypothetical protein